MTWKDAYACLVTFIFCIYLFCYFKVLKIYARLFPLVGEENTPASPSSLISKLSLVPDDTEFVIVSTPTNTRVNNQHNDDVNDEKASNISENQEAKNNARILLRPNSSPRTFSTFKSAIRNGI